MQFVFFGLRLQGCRHTAHMMKNAFFFLCSFIKRDNQINCLSICDIYYHVLCVETGMNELGVKQEVLMGIRVFQGVL